MNVSQHRKRLAFLRCLQECINCFKDRKKLPECLCYVPSEVIYKCTSLCFLQVYSEPSVDSIRIRDLKGSTDSIVTVTGEEMCNSGGKWLKVVKFKANPSAEDIVFDTDAWILLFSCKTPAEDLLTLKEQPPSPPRNAPPKVAVNKWSEVVIHHFSLDLRKKNVHVVPPDITAVVKLQTLPSNWTIDHDEALVRLMSKHLSPENEQLGSIKTYVDAIEVSSYVEDYGASCLTDGDPDTYWESDGSQGRHWIKLKMKKGTIVKKLQIGVHSDDDNYLPSKITVKGGAEWHSRKVLNTINIDWDSNEAGMITVLENMTEHYLWITIKIEDCKSGGIDTRIRELKLVSTEERTLGFDLDFFKAENLIRYPILETYKPEELYQRSQVLQRFIEIIDSVLYYIVPAWEYSIGSYSSLEYVRQLLPLSKRRLTLIETCLKESALKWPNMPKLFINRRLAMEHRCDPTADPECKNSVFMQIYEGLKPRDRTSKPLNYRWSSRYDQWWECKFISEGVIDQGGGFRDSMSDLAAELCPSASDCPVPLPFFIRSPNQFSEDSNINRDVYVPNPQCRDFPRYDWIGQLMGACLRGKENLVLSLPPFFWKKMVCERVTWERDFFTVDAATVKMIDTLETMESSEFSTVSRNWSCTLSDGSVVHVKLDGEGNAVPLKYDDRDRYCREVRRIRMTESDEQLNAIQTGLLKTIPQAVLDLLTWQELEQRISGDPEITIDALRLSTHYDDVEEKDTRVRYMWEALKNFSNEDRSRFLRFITGRRRLPASVHISSSRDNAIDCLPESSTCGNALYLPNYTSAKIAEEKIRYATYNCMDIDTDMNLWED
ncbi:E3 ubiquitin-protein ligase HECTD3-like isoform X2 [Mya arenaria]|uniref:E3 ubiquitin-protein ligase HECTD3-like isoform X2 n=1 Tax=Mya arenaria TaxID=6604 RepID=UPI0022E4F630|nr:E3 ubiquitin-protein ligase HECTD3-like isoform X2 [Mya arenaria]